MGEKSAVMRGAEEVEQRARGARAVALLGMQQERWVASIQSRPTLRVVRPQEVGEASHPGRGPMASDGWHACRKIVGWSAEIKFLLYLTSFPT